MRSDTCGKNLRWELYDDGILTIGNSVTTIGSCTFYGLTNLTSVTIPDSHSDDRR